MHRKDEIRKYYHDLLAEEQEKFLADEEYLAQKFEARLGKAGILGTQSNETHRRNFKAGAIKTRRVSSGEKSEILKSSLIAAAAAIVMIVGSIAPSAGDRFAELPGVEILRKAATGEQEVFGEFPSPREVAEYWVERNAGTQFLEGGEAP